MGILKDLGKAFKKVTGSIGDAIENSDELLAKATEKTADLYDKGKKVASEVTEKTSDLVDKGKKLAENTAETFEKTKEEFSKDGLGATKKYAKQAVDKTVAITKEGVNKSNEALKKYVSDVPDEETNTEDKKKTEEE